MSASLNVGMKIRLNEMATATKVAGQRRGFVNQPSCQGVNLLLRQAKAFAVCPKIMARNAAPDADMTAGP